MRDIFINLALINAFLSENTVGLGIKPSAYRA